MTFIGRTRELGRLRAAFDRPEASLITVSGLRGVGKTELVEKARADFQGVRHLCGPWSDAEQITVVMERLQEGATAESWGDVLSAALAKADPGAAPFILVLDDAYRLTQGRARMATHLRPF